uniref:Regulator of G protein signaling 9a n=1 Tax=Oreochromis aureus TaxID=47969 RepID=A0AAZ1XCP7_OREAU
MLWIHSDSFHRPSLLLLFSFIHLCFQLESILLEMQDPKIGVKGTEQKLNISTIPHVIAGNDIIAWISNKMKTSTEEAQAFGTMLVAYGYIYPLQNHKKLVMCNDSSLYRFQVNQFAVTVFLLCFVVLAIYLAKRNIRKKVVCACACVRAGKERKKPDRVVFDCQERAYWMVNRPPVSLSNSRRICVEKRQWINEKRLKKVINTFPLPLQQVRGSELVKYITTYKNHDPFLASCLPSNPWQTDHDAYWTLNMRRVEVPTKMRVERWSFSLFELLSDLRGRDDFKIFLKKEFSGENLAFWEAAEELKWGTASSMSTKAETIFKTFLAPGAPRWINIDGRTMGLTVKGLEHPHRYVLEAAQTHVFMLMKKDTFFRYLKSPTYKDIQKKALNPEHTRGSARPESRRQSPSRPSPNRSTNHTSSSLIAHRYQGCGPCW